MSKQTGVVNLKGKEYKTVALRVSEFREKYPDWTISTEIVSRDADCVVVKAEVINDMGRLIATGYAEEYRDASTVNKTSALENCETSAVGRALAAFGLAGSEYCSADELTNAITAKPDATNPYRMIKPGRMEIIVKTAKGIAMHIANEDHAGAYADYSGITDNEEKMVLWSFLESFEKSSIKESGRLEREGHPQAA